MKIIWLTVIIKLTLHRYQYQCPPCQGNHSYCNLNEGHCQCIADYHGYPNCLPNACVMNETKECIIPFGKGQTNCSDYDWGVCSAYYCQVGFDLTELPNTTAFYCQKDIHPVPSWVWILIGV